MPNQEHLDILDQGVDVWNKWRHAQPDIKPDLSDTEFVGRDFTNADFRRVNFNSAQFNSCIFRGTQFDGAKLVGAYLLGASLQGLSFVGASLNAAELSKADLTGANLRSATLNRAELYHAKFSDALLDDAKLTESSMLGTDFSNASLIKAHLNYVDARSTSFANANLEGAKLVEAALFLADFTGANLRDSDLRFARPVSTVFRGTDLTGSWVHGISTWTIDLTGAKQSDLLITDGGPEIRVDNLEIAQFVYLLLTNEKIRDVIDTVGKKAVLILGRFTPHRKAVLDAIRSELRKKGYVPILFDFELPKTRDITETVTLLAHLSRFVIADLSEPSSIPKELEAITQTLAVPVKPIIHRGERPYAMFTDYWKYAWVLEPYEYDEIDTLMASLSDSIIAPAEQKADELEAKRAQAFS